jgi:phosphate transport system protein
MESGPQGAPSYYGDLSRLKERLLAMGGEAEQQVRNAIRAVAEPNAQLAEQVLRGDRPINDLHLEIDERCLNILARQPREAGDLRVIVSGLKINGDLERIGDFAVNIAEATLSYLRHPPVKPLIDIPTMGDIAQAMLRDALNAYVRHDQGLATGVLHRDDEVDALKDRVFRELLQCMRDTPDLTTSALELILVSRHIERVADHATNIAEDVIFMISGRDIRHHAQEGVETG